MGALHQALLGIGAAAASPGGSSDGASVRRTSAQSVSINTDTAISFDTEDRDDGGTPGYWDAGDPTKFTAGALGYYLCAVTADLGSTGTGSSWWMKCRKNGTQTIPPSHTVQMDSAVDDLTLSCVQRLAASDYVEYLARHGNTAGGGAAVDLNAATGTILKIGTEGAEVSRAATQSISHNTATAISFDTEDTDDNGYYAAGNPTRLTVPQTGWYVFGCSAQIGVAALTNTLTVRLNNTTDLISASHDSSRDVAVGLAYYLTAGDYIEFILTHTTAASASQNVTARAWIAYKASAVAAYATRATTQSVPTVTTAAITMTAETRDDGGLFDLAGQPTRMTAANTGWHLVGGHMRFSANSGFFECLLRKGGSTQLAGSDNGQGSTFQTHQNPQIAVYLTAGEYVELVYVNPSGNTRTPGPFALWMVELG